MADKGPKTERGKMKNKTMVGIILLISLFIIAFSGCLDKSPEIEIDDVSVVEPKSLSMFLGGHCVEISEGESVKLRVVVLNEGEEIVHRNTCSVGIMVISPKDGDTYWELPSEQLIEKDLVHEGKSTHTFTVKQKKEFPVSGEFDMKAYVKSESTGKVIDKSKKVVIEIKK